MTTITDKEFGDIIVKRSPQTSRVRLSIAPNGNIRATLPKYAPMLLLKKLIGNSREQLRNMLREQNRRVRYEDGMQVGKSHTLSIQQGRYRSLKVIRQKQKIIAFIPEHLSLDHDSVISKIREVSKEAYRKEAKAHLPQRLSYIAQKNNFSYDNVRFSHASTRWGSCSSSGTISLNIALMKLPFELIDYVLIHELCHTKEMNHSKAFWKLVEEIDPNYLIHRNLLKNEDPSI